MCRNRRIFRLSCHLSTFAALTAAFLSVSLFNLFLVFRHESWCDEANAWLIARSLGPVSVYSVLSYEGHPVLWYYLLMPLTKSGLPYESIKLLSFGIMTVVVWLLLYRSPFPVLLRIFLSFSPMAVYFYAVIARNYCLVALFIILAAAFYKERFSKPLRYGLICALLLQTHIIMSGMVFAMSVAWLVEICRKGKRTFLSALPGLIFPVLSALLLLLEFHDIGNADAVSLSEKASLRSILSSYKWTLYSNLSELVNWRFPLLVLLCILIAAALVLLLFSKSSLTPLLIAAFGIAFQNAIYAYVYYANMYRLISWLYIFLWVLWTMSDADITVKENRSACFLRKCSAPLLLYTALIISLFGSSLSWGSVLQRDISGAFSYAKETAAAIDALPTDAVVFESSEDICNSVIPHLRRNKVYSPFGLREASYPLRSRTYRHILSTAELADSVKLLFPNTESFYLLHAAVDDSYSEIIGLNHLLAEKEPVYKSPGNAIAGEDFYIYRFSISELHMEDQHEKPAKDKDL